MLPFRIREDARNWFRDIRGRGGFSADFDSYYFCFMAGIAAARKTEMPASVTAELVNYFPDKYKGRGRLIVALFLSQELKEMGVEMREKSAVHSVISKLVMPESPNYLSEHGVREFNKYSHGGFEVLLDWFEDRPRSLPTFLRVYKLKVDDMLD